MLKNSYIGQTSGSDAEYELAKRLFPICRSITGDGVRETLKILTEYLPNLKIHEVSSGTKAFDWTVPDEWNIRDAYVVGPDGTKVIDFKINNLHLVGYSTPLDQTMSLDDLQPHLHSLPDQPELIPYVTSYYKRNWGFCIRHRDRLALKQGQYRVVIDSTLGPGHLTYGEIYIPGKSKNEIFFSTYICHPSMANNELSGPVVATFLAKWVNLMANPEYSYRFVFVPETIGSLVYMSRHLKRMQKNISAGFVINCCGDKANFSFLPSRTGGTLADLVAKHVLHNSVNEFTTYSFSQRASDERQYCSPRADLPVASIMRNKYHEYPEYHTSADDMSFISQTGLSETVEIYRRCVQVLETNLIPLTTTVGEPQLSSRGLYPTSGGQVDQSAVSDIIDLTAYSDGKIDLLEIAALVNRPSWLLAQSVKTLQENGLLTTRRFNNRNIFIRKRK